MVGMTFQLVLLGSSNRAKFLDMPYHVTTPQEKRPQSSSVIPFKFIIPSLNPKAVNRDQPVRCQNLPPSFNHGNSYPSRWSPRTRPQCSIVYKLHCRAALSMANTSGVSQEVTLEAEKEIEFLPYAEPEPPTIISSSQGEFITEIERPVWRHFCGRRIGKLRVVTEEPSPLVYTSSSRSPSTECTIHLSLSTSVDSKFLQSLSLRVTSFLRSKTFYSEKPINCVPTRFAIRDKGTMVLYDEDTRLGDSKFPKLKWTYTTHDGDHIETLDPDGSYALDKTPLLNSNRDSGVVRMLPTSPSEDETRSDRHGIWKASVRFPIAIQQRQQPTFCTELLARSYLLLFRLHIGGAYVEMLDCEVPLQVAYPYRTNETPAVLAQHDISGCLGASALNREESVGI